MGTRCRANSGDYARVLSALRDGLLDEHAAAELPRLNANVAALVREA